MLSWSVLPPSYVIDNWQRDQILGTVVGHYPILQTKSGPLGHRDLRFSES